MKVVINKCYGGYGLSKEAFELYAKKKNIKLYPRQSKYDGFGIVSYLTIPYEEWIKIHEECEKKRNYTESNKYHFGDSTIERNDPILVEVVEELGEKANGAFAKLHIVEIPDDINYEIEDYDGMEHIAEAHRTWG